MIKVCDDTHIGNALYKKQKLRLVTTGRRMGKTAIIQMLENYWNSEYLWPRCREEQKKHNYNLCSFCHERFKCWTASRPF